MQIVGTCVIQTILKPLMLLLVLTEYILTRPRTISHATV